MIAGISCISCFISIANMNNTKITTLTRVLLFLSGLGLLAVLYTPMWQIDLQAPQYPEGLKMFIYANKLAGDINIINGLNHYIGMKALHADDFIEFTILPGIIVFFSLLFLLTSIVGKKRWMNILCTLFVAFGILAMIDFWRWEYDYGHNLNPDAAIIVPGMAYQPPLIGFKQLLNFGAYSMPDMGGWIFVAVGLVLVTLVIFEWRRGKKPIVQKANFPLLVILLIVFPFISCHIEPNPIRIGRDNCDFCKMTISDNRFGAEIITQKNKVYKFDDAHCILAFLQSDKIAKQEVGGIYFTNFNTPHDLINVKSAFFLQSPDLKSPMNGNIAAFSRQDKMVSLLAQFKGNEISWEDLQK